MTPRAVRGSRPPRASLDPRPAALLAALSACAGATPPGRAALALGDTVSDDAALRAAERALVEGDLPRARELWAALERQHPRDALGRHAALRLARLDLAAPGDAGVESARARLGALPRTLDATHALRRSLVDALVTARAGRSDAALSRSLVTLRGRFVDAPEVVAADCAQVAVAPAAGPALEALARVEGAVELGVRWIPTGLACDGSDTRTERFQALLPTVDEPGEVATVLDALPASHPWRTPLARRLRTVAEARGEVRRWMSHLADLPDDEAAIRPVVRDNAEDVLRIGVLAPLSGSVANVGAEVVRSAQQAVEGSSRVELMLEDESRALPRRAAVGQVEVTPIEALVRSLRERGAVAIVGPALDANVPAARAAALAQGVPLWLPTPPDAAGGVAHAVGPTLRQRADAMAAAAARGGATRVALHLPTLPPDPSLEAALRAAMARQGVAVARRGEAAARHVIAGFFDEESQRRWATAAARSTTPWVIDARAAIAGTPGHWVGLTAAGGHGAYVAVGCSRSDRAPTEIAALYYDAVIEVVRARRPIAAAPALQRGGALVLDGVASETECPAPDSGR